LKKITDTSFIPLSSIGLCERIARGDDVKIEHDEQPSYRQVRFKLGEKVLSRWFICKAPLIERFWVREFYKQEADMVLPQDGIENWADGFSITEPYTESQKREDMEHLHLVCGLRGFNESWINLRHEVINQNLEEEEDGE
jgi:hypothetical protein